MDRNKLWTTFLLIIVLALFCLLVDIPRLPSWIPGYQWFTKQKVHLGLDLQGGTQLIYQADVRDIPEDERASVVEGVCDVIERRISQAKLSGALGVLEPQIQLARSHDAWRIIVEMPGIKDVNEAIEMIDETPILDFREQAPPKELSPEEKAQIEQFNSQAKARAEDILARLRQGADFSDLARQYSEDPGSKSQGGDLGWFGKGQMIPEFEEAVFEELGPGETSDLVETLFGYHIIKKEDERKTKEGELEVKASHILIITRSEELEKMSSEWQYTGLTGKQLKRAAVSFNPQTNEPEVSLEFDKEGAELFGDITSRNVTKPVAIFLDDIPLSIPTVREPITTGKAVITGKFDIAQAKELARRLAAGALAVPIELISQQNIGPSLGKISVENSFIAGLLGLLIVMAFMIFFYKGRGLTASVALIFYALIVLALFKLIPVTLTLAGIAGFILSIGMAVDANVLIFERVKEEERLGKPAVAAINDGFSHAWTAIRDGNITTLIVCFILYQFARGLVRGFGLTLGIGVLVSMFTAIIVTRTMLRLNLKSKI